MKTRKLQGKSSGANGGSVQRLVRWLFCTVNHLLQKITHPPASFAISSRAHCQLGKISALGIFYVWTLGGAESIAGGFESGTLRLVNIIADRSALPGNFYRRSATPLDESIIRRQVNLGDKGRSGANKSQSSVLSIPLVLSIDGQPINDKPSRYRREEGNAGDKDRYPTWIWWRGWSCWHWFVFLPMCFLAGGGANAVWRALKPSNDKAEPRRDRDK